MRSALFAVAALVAPALAMYVDPARLDACAGYSLASVEQADNKQLRATLKQAGDCGVFGDDVPELKLEVTYETSAYMPSVFKL